MIILTLVNLVLPGDCPWLADKFNRAITVIYGPPTPLTEREDYDATK